VRDPENFKNEEAMTSIGSQRHRKKTNLLMKFPIYMIKGKGKGHPKSCDEEPEEE
jgi:hypothetical protein